MLTFEQIKELIELVARRKLQALEVERSGFRLKIDGQQEVAPPALAPAGPAAPQAGAPEAVPAVPEATVAQAAGASEEDEESAAELPENAQVVKSPIVGTFYRAPAPDADPYVEVGARVKKGQVLCIVEAMKLMNEIEAEADGEVLEIYPDDAQPVEFGEPLFAVDPA